VWGWHDNAPNFHNDFTIQYLETLAKSFGIDYQLNFSERGEGKSDEDRHFGTQSCEELNFMRKNRTDISGIAAIFIYCSF
jgi:hypothetical protein